MTDTAPTAITPSAQVTRPDGRVEIAPGTPPPSGPYANADLLPVPVGKRTWTTYDFSALCVAQERTPTARQRADQRFRHRSRRPREHVSAVRG
ncbi:hypothetical protein ACH4UM_29575 [Streptomyces sp. NPDC020801]|uniref:hypothetical protein n=1 Tax=Streptomyces sp. NPDC020801 TaxID=3365093 RepID=UPI0037AAEED5